MSLIKRSKKALSILHPASVCVLIGVFFICILSFGEWARSGQSTATEPEMASEIVRVGKRESKPLPAKIRFNRDIRPILAENCFACHGPDAHEAKADVQMHTFEKAVDGFVITAGDPSQSEAWLRIINKKKPMPPKDSHKVLTRRQKDLIKRWIEQGAEYERHWAYVKPVQTPTPVVKDKSWPVHWIDNYLLARLENEGLTPVEDASKIALIRRLSFDLTGLPPTPVEVDAFVTDVSPEAYEKLVDRLLASPHFGERMAMYWLDVVRFADTVGYHGDQIQNITPYRDWVVWAFNENLPYDQFVTHQVAGDLIEDPAGYALIGSAYNRLYQSSHEGGIQRKEYQAIYDADRVRNFSEAFMGATIGCAQCHDHKYDPYTDEDFYSLAAFFGQMDDLEHLAPYDGRNFGKGTNTNPTWREPTVSMLSPLDKQRKSLLVERAKKATNEQERKIIQDEIDAIKPRKVMISKQLPEEAYRAVRFLPGGNWMDETHAVMQPAVPKFMGELATEGTPTRLDLARWLITPMDQAGIAELNARVMVNRLWYLLYGEGLCTTLGDFGGQGMPPTHPELLDRLALEFFNSDWDVKAMVKTMVMARAYRLSSEPTPKLLRVDQNNELFARQSQRRLPAEMIRDNALLVSGLLVDQLGGESARPYQPKGYYMHLNFPKRKYKSDTDLNQWRRGVYVHWQRQFLHPMLKAFDAPTREECTAKRPISNTPLASLVLLNDPTFVEAARNFAQRVLTESQGSDRERVDWAMYQLLSREATEKEAGVILKLLVENRTAFKVDPASASALLTVGISPREETLDPVEHAAWTEVCRLILNLHESVTRP